MWKLGYQKLARVSLFGDFLFIRNLRSFSYPNKSESEPVESWRRLKLNIKSIKSVFLYVVPFGLPGVAHLMLGLKTKEHSIVISPEIRYQSNQGFNWRSMFGASPLCYVWGLESDLVFVRDQVRKKERVIAIRLPIGKKLMRKLIISLVKTSEKVNRSKVRYHIFFNSCSHQIIKHLSNTQLGLRKCSRFIYTYLPIRLADRFSQYKVLKKFNKG